MMDFIKRVKSDAADIPGLFLTTFSASEGEGEGEGALIRELVTDLFTLPEEDVLCFMALEDDQLLGAVLFSKFIYTDQIHGLLLSPMAVIPEAQGKGVGQNLIRFAIEQLKEASYPFLVTYGDPNFYSKLGFQSISEKQLPAPYMLSMPQGWLALSLDGKALPRSTNKPQCVEPFCNPGIW
ncbi:MULTISPECIES: GNAT family N-acetyltransferase [unclassified Marinobacterium]|jgi:predicted N-acetyltransferase YhbS|uniref:GNAT family N-acetyltransferase n=1 Tax=unclassified Marinobacterium TaxID=2644139 RepID=UPI0015693B59|nr:MULTISPECIES: N-acetyltransferase [unclassified Marinobacterium]NRP51847.1 acetyltransferase [Marinobacterium sp. xm-v-242]NRP76428.1 acetyltransferase [Marinobacterium sp. xm-m-383]NRQ01568.1 acetyltransferase [Marinobacterium sp. xm-d-530]